MFLKNLFRYWTYQVFSPGTVLKEKYEAFKSLLAHDKAAHEAMAELEDIYYSQERVDFQLIAQRYNDLSENVLGIVSNLDRMCPSRYLDLRAYYKKFDSYVKYMLAPPEEDGSPPYTLLLTDVPGDGRAMVGGKAFNLSTIAQKLDLHVPAGFVITTHAYYYFIEYNHLRTRIDNALAGLDINFASSLDRVSRKITSWIMTATIPPDVEAAMAEAHETCPWNRAGDLRMAVRSSAVAEDERSSFAGQYHTELNVPAAGISRAYQKVIASKYSPRALYYRINYGLSDAETPMAVLALEMIDASASGVMYTKQPDDPESDTVDIHAIWGLGALLVGGEAVPDIIRVSRTDPPMIQDQQISEKSFRMEFSPSEGTVVVPVPEAGKQALSLDAKGALTLAKWGMQLESLYKEPQDVEWCRDPHDRLFILQSRPLKIEAVTRAPDECYFDDIEKTRLLSGGEKAASEKGLS